MEEIDVLIESLGETVEKLTEIKNEKEEEEKRIIEQRKKELEERKKSIDMSTLSGREGYYELDEILEGLEHEIVPPDKVSRFRQLYQELGYYDYRSFKPGQASKITDELHSIVRKPNDMTEVNKLITRFDFFIERCPSILKDDALNNRYEIIGIIIRGLNT